ncbi:hypothetical protein BC940DRAFT_304299 [Gongronella butleri]|nr:hypothetical protein BC940DRAFT_304299 [Gongronella butleri]
MAEDTSTYQAPARPGSDRLSKIVLKDDFAKNIVIQALLGKDGDSYRVADGEWHDCSRSDVVYEPIDNSQPTIIVEMQHEVTKDFMVRAIRYCTFAFKRSGQLPILIIVNTESTSVNLDGAQLCANLGAYLLECKYWATKAALVNARSANSVPIPHSPFVALTKFLLQKETCLLASTQWDDPIARHLFGVLQRDMQLNISRERQLLGTIQAVVSSSTGSMLRILETADRLAYDSDVLRQEAQAHIAKMESLKRNFDNSDASTSNHQDDALSNDEIKSANTIKFVDEFKEKSKRTKTGRNKKAPMMNWTKCYEELNKQPNVTKYKNAEVLRVQYGKYKRSMADH